MPLPDIPQTDYDAFEADRFGEDVDARIDGLGFEHAADSRIADLSRIGAWAVPPSEAPAAQEQAAPTSPTSSPPPVSPASSTPTPTDQTGLLVPDVAQAPNRGLEIVTGQPAETGVIDLRPSPAPYPVAPRVPTAAPATLPPGGRPAVGPLQDYARQAALRAGVDPNVFVRQIQQESGFNPNARSPAGAQGIAQIVPRFHPGVDVADPYQSLDYAARLMRSNLDKYGGNYAKALAAYNAGGGAVDRYGGVPPFEETQRYVDIILGGARPRGPAPTPAEGIARAGAAQAAANRDISQFGDPQLTNDEAYAACGPAAAVRFAQRYGRNPTLREATDLARSVGWTSSQGMAGLASEKALMDKLGVPTRMVGGADWGTFANEARTGNPVTISTRGHYFTADGWDPQSNRFHVGRSGLDLRGGKEWMTPEEMTAIMGEVQGGLLADNPQVGSPSMADQSSSPTDFLDRAKTAIGDSLGGLASKGLEIVTGRAVDRQTQQLDAAIDVAAQPSPGDLQVASVGEAQPLEQSPVDKLKGAFGDFIDSLSGNANQGAATTGAVPAPGMGFDPSSMRAVETPPQEGVPLRTAPPNVEQPAAAPETPGLPLSTRERHVIGEPPPDLPRPAAVAPGELDIWAGVVPGSALDRAVHGEALSAQEQLQVGVQAVQAATVARNKWIEENNPARDVPGVGGATSMAGQMVTDPLQLMAAGPLSRGTTALTEAIGNPAVRAVVKTALEGAGFGALQGAETPGATPESIAQTAATGAALGGALGAGGQALGRVAPSVIERTVPSGGVAYAETFEGRAAREAAEAVAGSSQPQLPGMPDAAPVANAVTEYVGNLRLPRWVQPEVRDVIRATYEADPARFEAARRGVISDEQLQQLAAQTGKSVDEIVSRWRPGTAENAETLVALGDGLAGRAQAVRQALAEYRLRPDSLDAKTDYLRAMAEHAAMQDVVAGTTGEAGRALRALRQAASSEDKLGVLQSIAKRMKMTPEELAEAIKNVNLDDAESVALAARAITKYSWQDKLQALWYFNLLSTPMTHLRNTVSNAFVLATRPIESVGSAAIDLPRSMFPGQSRERFFGEAPAMIFGGAKQLPNALREAYQTMRTGLTSADLANPELGRGEAFKGRLADLTVNVPGRALRASDAFFRSIHQGGSMYEQAYRQAAQEGTSLNKMADRITEILKNPTQEFLDSAGKEAAYRVFQQESGLANQLIRLREAVPGSRYVVPFIQTPFNVSKYVMERTPLGAVKILAEGRGQSGGTLSDRLARGTLGTATMLYFKSLADQGLVTGAAPRNETERDAFYRQGKQPYSIKIGDEWRSYAAMQPFTTLLGAATAASDAQKAGRDVDALTMTTTAGMALGRTLIDQPWTQGISDFLDVINGNDVADMDRFLADMGRYGQRQFGSVVPGIVRAVARASDPVIRETDPGFEGIKQTLAASIPGLTENAPARLTAFGEEARRPTEGLQSMFDPTQPSPANPSKLEAELDRLQRGGYGTEPGLVGKRMTAFEVPVEMTPQQQRQYQRLAGSLTEEMLESFVDSPEWDALSDADKAKTINQTINLVRGEVRKALEPGMMDQAVEAYKKQERQRAEVRQPTPTP